MNKENQKLVDSLKGEYMNYLLDKVESCYRKEVEQSFKEIIKDIENQLKENKK